jgi:hypothetical protein
LDHLTEEQITEACARGFIRAIQSQAAQEAVEGALANWFDKQSGRAVRRILGALAISVLIFIASNSASIKRALTIL